ncbi:MAG: hypothetical protein JNL67_08180 [Planctomycetaceae bacterium]|nr:hypothetical protein [Planctomycetaceae bacterium]
MHQPATARPAAETFRTIHRSAVNIGQLAEGWVFRADAERRFHYRSDDRQLDEMLNFLVESSLIFGDDE